MLWYYNTFYCLEILKKMIKQDCKVFQPHSCTERITIQQGLKIRGFWFQKKTVQLKTALREVYTYVLKGFFFKKQCISKAFGQNPRISRLLLCNTVYSVYILYTYTKVHH